MMSVMKLVLAAFIGFVCSSLIGSFLVPWLRKIKVQQMIRTLGPNWHMHKSGTPTMGGVMFIIAIIVVCLTVGFSDLMEGNRGHILVLLFGLVFGAIGFLDDYEKVVHRQNLGLTAKVKFALQLFAAVLFILLLNKLGFIHMDLYVPFVNKAYHVSPVLYYIFAAFVIVGTVNSINLTDGLDGLAGGTCSAIFLGFTAISFCWGQNYFNLSIFSAGTTGALLGYLIYNFYPAKIFMGDTGSLFLGGCIAGMAFALDAPLILVLLCIMPVLETISDIIQVGYFKLSHGKRVFKMAPFHHHLEMGGWTGRKWNEKQIFSLFVGITLVMSFLTVLGVMNRFN